MANSLDRDIEEGEVVVIAAKYMKPEYKELKHRLFVAIGGFGMNGDTMGNAVFGHTLGETDNFRIEGYMLDPKETKAYQKKNGKFLKPT